MSCRSHAPTRRCPWHRVNTQQSGLASGHLSLHIENACRLESWEELVGSSCLMVCYCLLMSDKHKYGYTDKRVLFSITLKCILLYSVVAPNKKRLAITINYP